VAPKRQVDIILKAKDEASKVFENVANNTLPQFAKRVAQGLTAFVSVGAIEETFRRSIDAALEAEKATAGLAAALRAQGGDALQSLPALKAHAEALSRVSLADDEAIQGAQKLLVSIGGLRGRGLDDATKAALDLAAGLGIDLEQAATMIAKAAQGSTKEFSRLGFEFDKNATDGQKLATVLAGINTRFGGMAAGQIATAAGQIHELNEAFGELLETLGTKLLGGAQGIDVFTRALQALNDQANEKGTIGFWKSLTLMIAGAAGGSAGLAQALNLISVDAEIASAKALALADAMDPEKINDPFGVWATIRSENLKKLAESEAEAKKAAEAFAAAIARINADTAVQTFAAQGRTPKTPVSGPGTEDALRRIVEAASGPSAKDIAAADAIDEQTDAVIALSKAVGTVEEAWAAVAAVQQAIGDATPEQAAALIKMGNDLIANAKIAEERTENTKIALDALTQAAQQLGDTFVEAAFGAEISWDQALEQIAKGFAKAIIQALILKLITTALGGFGSAALSGGGVVGSSGIGPHAYSSGGLVYAATGMFVPRGTDTVPAMLTPGEIVLNRGVSQKILGGRASVVPTGSRGADSRPQLVTVKLGEATLTRLLVDNARSLVTVLKHIDARGL